MKTPPEESKRLERQGLSAIEGEYPASGNRSRHDPESLMNYTG